MIVQIVGHEDVGASIDMIAQFGEMIGVDQDLLALFPKVGTEIDAVVQHVRRWNSPAWVRLSIRPADLESFEWPCDFCGQLTTLSAPGDGLVLDIRSNDGPGSSTIISHRTCLADNIHSESIGERVRALGVGQNTGRTPAT
ncbi:hypothetical protein [Actinokineospora xionganensis]|uniref:hypothetical protein n=1 Tax=Actinokineospora xionganensis TaxID=2684470 RepID=UPI001C9D3649|nr:hypothetical protein [Actinokineospora xionganensis]